MGLVVRLSPGSPPELELHAANLGELDMLLRGMRAQGVYSALKGAARDFDDAPLAGPEAVAAAEAAIEQAFPGAQVIADGAIPAEPEPQVDLAAEARQLEDWNQKVVERAQKDGFAEANLDPPKPKCAKCGMTTTKASGTGANGNWEVLFCASGDKSHTKRIK